MKHKLTFLILAVLFSVTLQSQTLHTIICTDTQDTEIGVAARASHDNYTLDFLGLPGFLLGVSVNGIKSSFSITSI